ncbi:hypothetical protein KCU89_g40, partial [Aureobasidium melanogenum]
MSSDFPQLKDVIYLDSAGTPLFLSDLIDRDRPKLSRTTSNRLGRHIHSQCYSCHKADCRLLPRLCGKGWERPPNRCFLQDEDIDKWILQPVKYDRQTATESLVSRYLASETYTLLDAAALASTSFLDLSDTATSPDFVAVSFYKIFGYPQLGALIVQRRSARPLLSRRYFGGGTVDMVTTSSEGWHVKKTDSPHDALEDGTPATHAIIAIKHAINCYQDKIWLPDSLDCVIIMVRLWCGCTLILALGHHKGRSWLSMSSEQTEVWLHMSTNG